jgi:hypothetical protein
MLCVIVTFIYGYYKVKGSDENRFDGIEFNNLLKDKNIEGLNSKYSFKKGDIEIATKLISNGVKPFLKLKIKNISSKDIFIPPLSFTNFNYFYDINGQKWADIDISMMANLNNNNLYKRFLKILKPGDVFETEFEMMADYDYRYSFNIVFLATTKISIISDQIADECTNFYTSKYEQPWKYNVWQ